MSTPIELYNEAEKLKAEGKLEEAITKLQAAIEAKPDYSLAHAALAVVYQKLGKHDEAISHAQRNCELEPNDPFSFAAMSVTYQRAYAGTGEMKYIPMAEEAMERSRILQMQQG
ncbi:tetratricopeptide repeat protein [Aeoliella mucimassa]|uniref:Tetratricopeptide repeat protein n=1 Tax=Aeoliella mucimassa TaxID=2527972 RepID=A0A518ART0_9BACT|nr:tetratricopeptide repeat protein [Aeoliella mucimassa]QDU57422.1 Tetratricopeptide repeat protein [Aeoliella mucimassa]